MERERETNRYTNNGNGVAIPVFFFLCLKWLVEGDDEREREKERESYDDKGNGNAIPVELFLFDVPIEGVDERERERERERAEGPVQGMGKEVQWN